MSLPKLGPWIMQEGDKRLIRKSFSREERDCLVKLGAHICGMCHFDAEWPGVCQLPDKYKCIKDGRQYIWVEEA